MRRCWNRRDKAASKAAARKGVWVRVPPAAPSASLRTEAEINEVKALAATGLNHCEIARQTGIPRSTVRDWLTGKLPKRRELNPDPSLLPKAEYSYLLGLYLGDGCISKHPRAVYRLRITLDTRYPNIITECAAAMHAVIPISVVHVQDHVGGSNAAEVHSYSKSWPYLFPQNGPGRKHTRHIALVAWQQEIVNRHPKPFLRGLIHSDGCRTINKSMGHQYLRYFFDQVSMTSEVSSATPVIGSASHGASQGRPPSPSPAPRASPCSTSSSDRSPESPAPAIIRR
jgi:hypothetical protein